MSIILSQTHNVGSAWGGIGKISRDALQSGCSFSRGCSSKRIMKHVCYIHKNLVRRAVLVKLPILFIKSQRKVYAGGRWEFGAPSRKNSVFFFLSVCDHITGTSFLTASSLQIFLIPATLVDRVKGSCKFTLQTINKSLIQTYGQKFSFSWI